MSKHGETCHSRWRVDSSENSGQMVAATSTPELPDGLVELLLDGKVLRADRIAECRRRLREGYQPSAAALAEAFVRDVVPHASRPLAS